MTRWAVAVVAASLIGAPAVAAPLGPAAGADPGAATETVQVVAVIDGRPAPGYRVADTGPGPTLDGCARSPFSLDPGIYACATPGAAGARACWPSTDDTALCLVDADDHVLHRHRLGGPLSDITSLPAAPLGLELADGAHCYPVWGGAWGGRPDGYAAKYSCSTTDAAPARLVLARVGQPPVDRSTPTWTVLLGTLNAAESPTTVAVSRALFAANPS